jgi:hypothetical protein
LCSFAAAGPDRTNQVAPRDYYYQNRIYKGSFQKIRLPRARVDKQGMDRVAHHDSPFVDCTLTPGKFEGNLSFFHAPFILRFMNNKPSLIGKNNKHMDN